ncbi:MAG: LysE family translocator [Sodalis sp. (in: enterobacteria)]
MSYTNWSAFLMIACFTAISPGPGSIQAMSYGLSQGWRKTSLIIAGQEMALALIVLAVGSGAGIILSSPKVLIVIRGMGAAWLVYAGYSTWCTPPIIPAHVSFISRTVAAPLTKLKRFMAGFMTTATNARVTVFMISLMPQFIDPKATLWSQLFLMTFTMVSIDALMMHVYAFSASRIQRFVQEPTTIRIQNRFFGGALMLSGVCLLFPF